MWIIRLRQSVYLLKDKPAVERVKGVRESRIRTVGQAESRQLRSLSRRRVMAEGTPRPG